MNTSWLVRAIAAVVLLLASAGCASTVPGRALAGGEAAAARTPVTISDDGYGVVLGAPDDAAIDLYVEPQCPHCAHFLADYGDAIGDYLNAGRLAVTVRPLTFLDDGSNRYSARATNAIFLVATTDANASGDLVWRFIEGMYDELLATQTLTSDDGIAQIANDVGVSADTVNRIAAGEPAIDADEVTDGNIALMDESGLPAATPIVYDINDAVEVDTGDDQWLDDLAGPR